MRCIDTTFKQVKLVYRNALNDEQINILQRENEERNVLTRIQEKKR